MWGVRGGTVTTVIATGAASVSPRWAQVGNAALYFYASEPHRRPHVDVRGPGWKAVLDLRTGDVLASSGVLPPKVLRRVRRLLRTHQELALEAFEQTLGHGQRVTLEGQLEVRGE